MEPEIIINGKKLTIGQSMTLRVATATFVMDLKNDGLGNDNHGIAMKAAYLARLNEIINLMLSRQSDRQEE